MDQEQTEWHVATMNDGIFIINQQPHPAPVDYVNPNAPGPSLVISMGSGSREAEDLATRIVAAHNAQIVSDHRSAAAVPKLVAALRKARAAAQIRSDLHQKLHGAPTKESWTAEADEALTTVNQTGEEHATTEDNK